PVRTPHGERGAVRRDGVSRRAPFVKPEKRRETPSLHASRRGEAPVRGAPLRERGRDRADTDGCGQIVSTRQWKHCRRRLRRPGFVAPAYLRRAAEHRPTHLEV